MELNEVIQTEEDYDLQEFFPKTIPYHLQPLMEHKIKLFDAAFDLTHPLICQYFKSEFSDLERGA